MSIKLLLTGGGTGGHVYPALAIAEAVAAADPAAAFLYVGSAEGIERDLVERAGLRFAAVASAPFVRGAPAALGRTLRRNVTGVREATAIVRAFDPDVAVATGGYVTLPVMLAARLLRVTGRGRARLGLLEPNARPGLTNRLLAPVVDEIWLGTGAARGRALVTGTPVRASFRATMDPDDARRRLGLVPGRTTVVAIGGSQGAASLNAAVLEAAGAAAAGAAQMLLVAGKRDYDAVRARAGDRAGLVVVPYLDDPRTAYAAADLVVARAGASTLAELAATATPAVLVPYPFATGDHQTENARAFAACGSAVVIADRDLDGHRLGAELAALLAPERLAALRAAAATLARTDAAATIARRIAVLRSRGIARGRG